MLLDFKLPDNRLKWSYSPRQSPSIISQQQQQSRFLLSDRCPVTSLVYHDLAENCAK